ncbi:hypothetical protein MKW94_026180, partial [Papaver nudicaule]|nr:hypothetical protein [Papaver nudicaule]
TKRPYCDEFLKFCFENFHVGVWSSRKKSNVNKVVNYVMGDMKENLLFCWDASHCTETGFKVIGEWYKPLLLKELKKLWNKYEPTCRGKRGFSMNPTPYFFPSSYTRDILKDDSLGPRGGLRLYLEGLLLAGNVQKYVEQHPFGQAAITSRSPLWDFYLKVSDT